MSFKRNRVAICHTSRECSCTLTRPPLSCPPGPLTNLAYALDKYPQVADKIKHVWWMGGALGVRGNVFEPNTDGSAEWNAYCDPQAMGVVWNSSVPLTLVPLDGTNKVRLCHYHTPQPSDAVECPRASIKLVLPISTMLCTGSQAEDGDTVRFQEFASSVIYTQAQTAEVVPLRQSGHAGTF